MTDRTIGVNRYRLLSAPCGPTRSFGIPFTSRKCHHACEKCAIPVALFYRLSGRECRHYDRLLGARYRRLNGFAVPGAGTNVVVEYTPQGGTGHVHAMIRNEVLCSA